MEDQDIFFETKLDDGNILLIGHVLEIKPYELLFFLRPFKPSIQFEKITRHHGALVRVDDTKFGRAMCGHLLDASDSSIHGGRWGRREGEDRGGGGEGDEQEWRRTVAKGYNFPTREGKPFGSLVPVRITNRD